MANIRVRQAAEYCGLSKSLLDKLRCKGGGPVFMRLGRSVVYSTDDLDSWLADSRQAGNKAANDNNRLAVRAA